MPSDSVLLLSLTIQLLPGTLRLNSSNWWDWLPGFNVVLGFAGLKNFVLFCLNCSSLLPSALVPPVSRCVEVSYVRCFAYQLLCIYTRCNYAKCLLFNVYFLVLWSNSSRNTAWFYFLNIHKHMIRSFATFSLPQALQIKCLVWFFFFWIIQNSIENHHIVGLFLCFVWFFFCGLHPGWLCKTSCHLYLGLVRESLSHRHLICWLYELRFVKKDS